MGLETSVLNQVIDGRKPVEARIRRGKFLEMTVGTVVCLREDVWQNGKEIGTKRDQAKIQVVQFEDFRSFGEMFDTVGLENVLPEVESIQEGLELYYQFYTPEEEAAFGVRAITMQLLGADELPGRPLNNRSVQPRAGM